MAALTDEDADVRRAAGDALRELVEVLPASEEMRAALVASLDAGDPLARVAVIDVLRALKLGDVERFRAAAADADPRVRIQGVRGLVSLDDTDGVATVATDEVREVRVVTAHGLGTIGDPASAATLEGLADDADLLVRAAALEATAGLPEAPRLWSLAASSVEDPAWQVRVGAARGLANAPDAVAVTPLLAALGDSHADVRKAAVLSLAARTTDPEVRDAVERATKDADADVRGYARRAL